NGTERVVVSQLVRSPGVYFSRELDKTTDKDVFIAKIIPGRGAWLEFDVDKKDTVGVRIDRKRRQNVTVMLKALGWSEDEILKLFNDAPSVKLTLEKDHVQTQEEALEDIYRKLRPGEPPTAESAKTLLENLFFNPKRYDLAKVGRHKADKKLAPAEGELIQNQIRIGLSRMERVVKERMTTQDVEAITPQTLINIRPVVASIKEFFGTSQLSQFMNQTNTLAGLTHRRRLSALGPGGLSRERAGFEVRDVHPSHYGRMCPIETPEGPNIGLIGSLSSYARINRYGFVETPYRKVVDGQVTTQIDFLSADEEDVHVIAQASAVLDKEGR